MKRYLSYTKKHISILLIITMLFSLFSEVITVNAEVVPGVKSIQYERVRENTLSGPKTTNTLIIYGSGFVNPKVKAGLVGAIPIPINASLSSVDKIVIDDQKALDQMEGIVNIINIMNNGTEVITGENGITLDLSSIPTISNASTDKVYIDNPLDIDGMVFNGLNPTNDKLFVARTEYKLGTEAIINNNKIHINTVKSPIATGKSSIAITRNLAGSPNYQIISTLKDCITVVDKLQGIEIERVDPNSGPRDTNNVINIYGKAGKSGFNPSMRIFINSLEGQEGVNKGIITDMSGKTIGLKVQLPKNNVAGAVNLVLTNPDRSSEFIIPNGFIYLDIGNTLTIEPDGVNPSYKKETEDKPITIMGRNIGYFDAANYDNLSNVSFVRNIGYAPIANVPQANNITSFKVEYKGKYNTDTEIIDVTIIRQINIFVDGDAKILDKPDTTTPPVFTKSKDTLVVRPADVNLDPNQPKDVDVKVKTSTIIYNVNKPSDPYYSRIEEYTKIKGFTYIPDEIAPTVNSITPDFGPYNKDMLITIKGFNFQVLEDGRTPSVRIGDRVVEDKLAEGIIGKVKVYDSQNRLVDGRKIQLGTKITITLPKGTIPQNGAVDVVVKNPSQGQYTVVNGFTFKNPVRDSERMPKIISLKEAFADMRGGILTGETVLITGENFDAALDGSHRVLITIGGEKAEISGKVSADGKTVTVIPPPGAAPGLTKLQLINEDGSMAEADFEYRRAITAPKITRISPIKGGKGTKLVIKGEDFVLPDNLVKADDPRRKGTVVLLNGKELNAYLYDKNLQGEVVITDKGQGIYYNGNQVNGKMVTVVDGSTIYVDIPDKFYSLDASGEPPYLQSEEVPLGNLKVEVLNPDGTKSKENVLFTFLRPATYPKISSITPASGSINGGTIISILGSNFKQDELSVFFGSEKAQEIQFINSTELRIKVPIYPYGLPAGKDRLAVPVMVMNYDGGAYVMENGFEYRIPGSQPVITSLSPVKGSAAGNEQVVIRGRDFRRDPSNSSIIPKVYFNGVEAKVSWLGIDSVSELLVAITPPSKVAGPVDVVIVNYDSGSYTYKSFNYEISRPVINSVTPNSINKQGGNKLQINGTGFKKTDLAKLIELQTAGLPKGSDPNTLAEQIGRNTSSPVNAAKQIDSLVVFGDGTTGDKKAIDIAMGLRDTELNDIGIECTSVGTNSATIKIYKANDSNRTAIRPELTIPFGSSHLFIINGEVDLGAAAIGDEGLLVEVTPNQVIATRRIATFAKWENDGMQITAAAPAVGGIGSRKLYVQNADGGIGSYGINVLNPASSPTITYISPRNKVKRGNTIVDYTREEQTDQEYYTYTPLSGGAFITINGTDFRRNVKVYLDNRPLEILSRSLNDDQLMVKIPSGTESDIDKLYRIVVVNEDGGSADSSSLSKPHYIVYKIPQSRPIIENIVPGITSSKGENVVKLIGDDFREGTKVFIEGVECLQVTRISYKELAVRIPLGLTPGKKLIQVMNPDYGFGEKKDALTIVSSPRIDTVYDHVKGTEMSPALLSINGGQSIRLVGRDFLNGVKVIIGGTLKSTSELQSGETGIKCYDINDREMTLIGGKEATNIRILNNTVLTFTTPKLNVGEYSIIVVNSDGGVSNLADASYQKPKPDTPTGIFVEAVDSDTIKLEWDKIPDTKYYEIYASYYKSKSDDDNFVYIGSVEAYEVGGGRLRYFVGSLRASSWYSFRLKSVNSYGPSVMSPASDFVKTMAKKQTDYYKTPGENASGVPQQDKVSITGSSMTFIVGEKSLQKDLSVNLDQAAYNNYNPKNVDIGISTLREYPNNLVAINEKDFVLQLESGSLLVAETYTVPASKLDDSKVTIGINKDLRAKGDEIRAKVPVGYKAITSPVAISVTMQVQQERTAIKSLNGDAYLIFNVTNDIKRKYAGGIYIAYYNNGTKKLDMLSSTMSDSVATAKIDKTGEYVLVGKYVK